MIQIIKENRPENTSDKFVRAFGNLAKEAQNQLGTHLENSALKDKYGVDVFGIQDPNIRLESIKQKLTGKREQDERQSKLDLLKGIFGKGGNISLKNKNEENLLNPGNEQSPNNQLNSVEASNLQESNTNSENISDEELAQLALIDANLARVLQHSKDVALREKTAQRNQKAQETQKQKEEIVQRANSARKGIQNKKQLLNLIKTKKIDDPTYAMVAENLPFNLGERLLSPETVTYKAAMVDEFGDLRNIFQGQTRVKEIEIMEKKLANLYLTDDQKEAILKSRIDALQADVVKEEAASEVDEKYPNLGLFQFNKKVNELTQKKLEKVFGQILDEQQFVLNQAEKRKDIPLNPDNPQDLEIMRQIKIEAGGNKDKAKALAKSKGYKW